MRADLESRKRVEQLYGQMSVYNGAILFPYLKSISAPEILIGSLAVIVGTFISLANGLHMPLLLLAFTPVVPLSAIALMFGQIHEGVCISRASENIIGQLLSPGQACLVGMARTEKIAVLKRARSFRALLLPIGGFCLFSISVIQVIWEEILNQILFLFSL